MKKLMIAAAAMMAGVAMADVESANVVGYTTETLAGGRWLIAQVGFQTTAGEDIDLQDLIQGIQTTTVEAGRGTGWDTGAAPRIQLQRRDANGVITGGGNNTYYYIANASVKAGATRTDPDITFPGWADSLGKRLGAKGTTYVGETLAAAVKVKPGTAFWYQDPADSTITFAGQVLSPNQVEVFIPAGKWGLVCNPFPMAVNVNSVKIQYEGLKTDVEAGRGTGWDTGAAPRIQLQRRGNDGTVTGGGNNTYFYVSNATVKSGATRTDPDITYPGWADSLAKRLGKEGTDFEGEPVVGDVMIPAGAGFWFQNPTDCTITFSK